MTGDDPRRLARTFLVLQGLRWAPTGLLLPVVVLLLTSKGLTVAEVGAVLAAQGVTTFLLELPTGGLADTWGRRPVLVVASTFSLAAYALLLVGDDLPSLLVAGGLLGVFRALESGPVESWYVDRALAIDAGTDLERTLAHAGVAVGVAMGLGALAAGGLVAWDPLPVVPALALPVVTAAAMRVVELVALLRLLDEPSRRRRDVEAAPTASLSEVVRTATGAAVTTPVLRLLLVTTLLWGLASSAFEVLPAVRLETLLGDTQAAAGWLGPLNAGAWAAVALGAAGASRLQMRVGAPAAAALLLATQAVAVAGMGLAGGAVGLVAGYLLTYGAHGGGNPLVQGLAHRAIDGDGHRTTVVSALSMAAMVGGAAGGVALGWLADLAGPSAGMLAGAALLSIGAMVVRRVRPGSAVARTSDPAVT